jgi:YrbI family 3-deoxy-D-manno-octulosonate 8-phosphate phosphatase
VIRLLALDVDGVLTTGDVLLDEDGRESKTLFFRDVDAVFAARRAGLRLALVSGEQTPMLQVIAARLEVDTVVGGRKDKEIAVAEVAAAAGLTLAEVCYVGDAIRDAPALRAVGLGLAPADAAAAAREAADRVLDASGGRGAVEEAVELLLAERA